MSRNVKSRRPGPQTVSGSCESKINSFTCMWTHSYFTAQPYGNLALEVYIRQKPVSVPLHTHSRCWQHCVFCVCVCAFSILAPSSELSCAQHLPFCYLKNSIYIPTALSGMVSKCAITSHLELAWPCFNGFIIIWMQNSGFKTCKKSSKQITFYSTYVHLLSDIDKGI